MLGVSVVGGALNVGRCVVHGGLLWMITADWLLRISEARNGNGPGGVNTLLGFSER